MILIEFLFAPTVPSDPSPQNLQETVPSGVVSRMLRNRQGVVGYVILDSDSEAGLGLRCFEIVIDGDHTAGRGILGTETITAADNLDIASARDSERGCDVKVKGFAKRAGLFCTVEHSNAFDGLRQRRKEAVGCERAIQADFDKADFFALGAEVIDGFFNRVIDRANGDDDMLCVRCAVVVKQFVVAADSGVDLVHAALNDLRQGVVIRVAGFTGLEIDVGVLRSTAQNPDAPG